MKFNKQSYMKGMIDMGFNGKILAVIGATAVTTAVAVYAAIELHKKKEQNSKLKNIFDLGSEFDELNEEKLALKDKPSVVASSDVKSEHANKACKECCNVDCPYYGMSDNECTEDDYSDDIDEDYGEDYDDDIDEDYDEDYDDDDDYEYIEDDDDYEYTEDEDDYEDLEDDIDEDFDDDFDDEFDDDYEDTYPEHKRHDEGI